MFDPNGPTFLELARQALSSTTTGYDLLAPKFENTPFRTADELLEPMVLEIVRSDAKHVLDLACGTGAIARRVAEAFARNDGHHDNSQRILGIDISTGMLAEARRLSQSEGVNCEFQNIDVFEMSFDEEFDVVATSGAFGHILQHQQRKFIDLVWSALKPGGRFIFITSPMPKRDDPSYWLARGFNAAMHLRNTLIDPPFIMFYLTFPLERASQLLWDRGFDVRVEQPYRRTPYARARLVIATKRIESSYPG